MVILLPIIGIVIAFALLTAGAVGLRASLTRMFGKPLKEGELARARVILLCASAASLVGFLIAWSSGIALITVFTG